MKKKVLVLLLAMVMVLSVALTGCDKGSGDDKAKETGEQTADSKDGGVLTIALSATPKNMDPVKYTGLYEGNVIASVCNTLVYYDKDLKEIIPGLATEWSISDDLTQYTFKLRDDVYFQEGKYQDGRKMTAEDVKYSLERSAKESVMGRLRMLDHVEVVSDTEIVAYLKSANAAFLTVLTDSGNSIVPKEEVEGWGDAFGMHLVGTGPFKFKELKKDDCVILERHEKYWGERPHLDGVTFKFIADTNMRANALRTGEIDVATDLKGESIQSVKQDEKLVVTEKPGMQVSYLAMNLKEGPTKDKKVREAILSAINVDDLIKGLYPWDEAQKAYLALPPGSWGYDESLEDMVPKYDPENAKKLLKEAGYENGFELNLYITDAPVRVKMATIIQSYLKENLNIDVKINTAEWGTFSEIVSKGNADLYAMSWAWYPDPDFFLYQMFHSEQIGSLGNGQGFENAEVDDLLNKAVSQTADQNERAELYKQALKLITEDYAKLNYSNEKQICGLNKNVHEYTSFADGEIFVVHPQFNVWKDK